MAENGAGNGLPHPRETMELVGHEDAERLLLDTIVHRRLGHAWLITGPRGIGKATLAYRVARFLLATARQGGAGEAAAARACDDLSLAADHPVFRRVASGGHADLMTIERSADERTKRLRGEIVVGDVRRLSSFFTLTAAEGGRRIAIIDSADELNRNAANALLKVLEEPPPGALLLLVAHVPGRVLPTIRSRCRKLTLAPLGEAQLMTLLAQSRPDLDDGARRALAGLAAGSPGRALTLAAEGGLDLYGELIGLMEGLPKLDIPRLHALADRLVRADGDPAWRALAALFEGLVARLVRTAAGAPAGAMAADEAPLLGRLAPMATLDQWLEVWEKVTGLFASADGLNLDRKQVLITAFTSLARAGRRLGA